MSEPPGHRDDKDEIDAEFTDADLDRPSWENAPDLRSALKPQRKTWVRAAWSMIFLGGIGLGAHYLATHRPTREPEPSPQPGWDQLTRCSFVTSFDGNKSLSFSEDGRAEMYDNTHKDNDAIIGEWRFDEATNLFTVTFTGISNSYAMAEPGQGPICMLLKGELQAADLKGSWFSPSSDETPDPGD
jgi:hypothetical protein